jgi:hypothetical protein
VCVFECVSLCGVGVCYCVCVCVGVCVRVCACVGCVYSSECVSVLCKCVIVFVLSV